MDSLYIIIFFIIIICICIQFIYLVWFNNHIREIYFIKKINIIVYIILYNLHIIVFNFNHFDAGSARKIFCARMYFNLCWKTGWWIYENASSMWCSQYWLCYQVIWHQIWLDISCYNYYVLPLLQCNSCNNNNCDVDNNHDECFDTG